MRTKEVEQALELLEKIKISESMNVYIGVKDIKKVNTLIQYIHSYFHLFLFFLIALMLVLFL